MFGRVTSNFTTAALIAVLITSLSCPMSSMADGGLYLKGYGGVNYTAENDFEASDALSLIDGSEVEYKTGHLFGFALGYRMHNGLALELDYATRANDIDSIDFSSVTVKGDIESSAIMANLIYYPSYSSLFSPYMGGGLGFLKDIDTKIELDDTFFDEFDDSTIAWQAFVGVNISALENLSVFGEARFFSGPSPEFGNDTATLDLDYNNLGFLIGLNFSLT